MSITRNQEEEYNLLLIEEGNGLLIPKGISQVETKVRKPTVEFEPGRRKSSGRESSNHTAIRDL